MYALMWLSKLISNHVLGAGAVAAKELISYFKLLKTNKMKARRIERSTNESQAEKELSPVPVSAVNVKRAYSYSRL